VSKLTTDVLTYCTEASNQKSKYAYRKMLFYKKTLLIAKCQSKCYIAEIGITGLFCSCDLDLEPMTLIYELDPYMPSRYIRCTKMSRISKIESYLITDRQTSPKLYTTPLF